MPGGVERLLTIVDLSEILGLPVDTFYGWRQRGEGLQGYRIGRHVRYRRSTVEAWLGGRLDRAGLMHDGQHRTAQGSATRRQRPDA